MLLALRHRLRAGRGAALRQGPGRRCRDGRRRVAAGGDVLRHAGGRALERDSAAPTCSIPARPGTTSIETRDGKYVSIGSIEPKFYARAARTPRALPTRRCPQQHDRNGWPALRERFTNVFKTKTRDEWCAVFEGSDACFAPVLTFSEARAHPHNVARAARSSRVGRRRPARAGAALLAHAGRRAPRAARARRRRPRRRCRLGLLRRRRSSGWPRSVWACT